jgi:hypothetical protein
LQVGDTVRLKKSESKPDGVRRTTAKILSVDHGGMEGVIRLDFRLGGSYFLHKDYLEKVQ